MQAVPVTRGQHKDWFLQGINPASPDPALPAALARELSALFGEAKQTGNVDPPITLMHAAINGTLRGLSNTAVACKKGCSHCCYTWVSVSAGLQEVKDRYRTSVTALSGLAQADATLISARGRFKDGSTDSRERNPTGTEPKVKLEKQCEWKRGSEILRSKIMAAFQRKCRVGAPAIPSYWSISHRATLSRLPCGSLRSALTETRRDARNQFSEEGMAGP